MLFSCDCSGGMLAYNREEVREQPDRAYVWRVGDLLLTLCPKCGTEARRALFGEQLTEQDIADFLGGTQN